MANWSVRDEFDALADRVGGCSICNSDLRKDNAGKQERAITTGVYIEMEGLFTICESCLTEGANLIGMIPTPRAQALAVKNRELGLENHRLKGRLAAMERAVETLKEEFE